MNCQSFNDSFSVLASGQPKPGHVVLVNGKRHRGGTNLPLARFGPIPRRSQRVDHLKKRLNANVGASSLARVF
jgi:hypothetical protein